MSFTHFVRLVCITCLGLGISWIYKARPFVLALTLGRVLPSRDCVFFSTSTAVEGSNLKGSRALNMEAHLAGTCVYTLNKRLGEDTCENAAQNWWDLPGKRQSESIQKFSWLHIFLCEFRNALGPCVEKILFGFGFSLVPSREIVALWLYCASIRGNVPDHSPLSRAKKTLGCLVSYSNWVSPWWHKQEKNQSCFKITSVWSE